MNHLENSETTIINFIQDSTSVPYAFFDQPTEATDNISFAIKNSYIVVYEPLVFAETEVYRGPEYKPSSPKDSENA